MSLKNPQYLLIIGAVVAALLAGTILLGSYTNILPAGSDTGPQAEAPPATEQTSCPIAKARLAEAQNVKAGCPREAAAGFDAKTCPLGRTEPCCAEEGEGCCPKIAEGCCPKIAEGCCPKEAEGCCPKEAASGCPKEAASGCPAEAKTCSQ